ncbi:hypothetical protein BRPE64_DCDS06720 (plasmid) [Caballeronia insecticola]|uniref:Uncharacterized protein n=1 Tax=Caballeronia insecticola TaxID=758793 RepID=R4WSI8_9BURK|nr:hypothetical protein BRPE64_DCDS06720 [Caballeronia insecticola]
MGPAAWHFYCDEHRDRDDEIGDLVVQLHIPNPLLGQIGITRDDAANVRPRHRAW